MAPGGLDESGKIMGKDLWVRAHSRETPLNDCLKGGIAPVELNGLNEIIISKWLQQIKNGKHESSEISSALQDK